MSFPSLHDALSSLLPGAHGGPEWLLRAGLPGLVDDVDHDDRRGDPARGNGPPDVDADAISRPPHATESGGGGFRHAHAEVGIPPQARQAMSEALRGPASQPLAPPPAQWDASLQALARELQQLPPSVIRQLSDALSSNPAALRALPAQPEALATVLARGAPEAGPPMHAAGAEARRLAQGGEAAPAGRGGPESEGREWRLATSAGTVPEARTSDPRSTAAALESRIAMAGSEARPGQPAEAQQARGSDPALAGAGRGQGATELSMPAAALRADPQSATHPAGTPAAATQAPTTAHPEGWPMPGARAEAAGTAAERGAQAPGLGGLGGVAAGMTLAAVATPAGTTHAHAPDSAVRARSAEDAQGRRRKRGDADGDGHGGKDNGRGQGGQHASGTTADRAGAAAPSAAAATARQAAGASIANDATAAAGAATAGATAARADEPGSAEATALAAGSPLHAAPHPPEGAMGHTGAAQPHQQTPERIAAGVPEQAPEALQSRHRQWLYWSLIVVTYACLGGALATVAPELSGLPISQESLGLWRNGLTGVGLLTGLWAWQLARRMR